MAKRMKTSRSQLERFTIQKAAAAIGKRMTIGLVDVRRVAA
jgi:hypothetical protein